MLKPLVGSVALTFLGAGALGADEAIPDISTWRWHVSMITRAREQQPPPDRIAFNQRYERYYYTGARDASADGH